MIQRNSTLAVLRESFVAGSDENLSPIMHHLWKMEGGAIYFCRSGWAHVTIDLKEYEIVKNTQVVLLPGSIIRINGSSSDFTASFFGFPKDMFREAADIGVVSLCSIVEVFACYVDTVFRSFQLGLQLKEVLIGLQVGIVFRDSQQLT